MPQVAMIGVSSFACAAIHLLSQNVEADDQFDPCIKVWVQEPMDEFEVSTRVSVRSIKVWVQEPMVEFEVSSCVCTQRALPLTPSDVLYAKSITLNPSDVRREHYPCPLVNDVL